MHAKVVRTASKADVGAIQTIDVLSFAPEEQYDSAFYDSLWTGTRFKTYVGVIPTGAIVAYALVDFDTEPVRLHSIAVHPNYRRCGLGYTILRHVVASILSDIDLFVDADNIPARRLYEQIGFRVDPNSCGSLGQVVMRFSGYRTSRVPDNPKR